MTKRTKYWLLVYFFLLFFLALLGAHNQQNYVKQHLLIEQKSELQKAISELRHQSADTTGHLAIRHWAHEQGMVPAPQVTQIRFVQAMAAPSISPIIPKLEIETRWR